jgi:hypothetical protein
MLHILTVLSHDPEAKFPFDTIANDLTKPECPDKVKINDPVGLHIFTKLLSEPDAKLPFGNANREYIPYPFVFSVIVLTFVPAKATVANVALFLKLN